MEVGKTLYVTNREEWRAWLEEYYASEREIWLIYYRKGSGKPRISYDDSVEEALCFGWIDSTVKNIDEERFAQRFTPRRPKSPVSETNMARVRRLIEQGKMTQAGMESLGGALENEFVIPADILGALQADAQVWENFQQFPESYKRIRVGWIEGARQRPDEFEKRLRYFIRMTGKNKRYGMVQ